MNQVHNRTGILTKNEIAQLIDDIELIKDATAINIQGCSYDLRIGTIFRDGQVINADHHKAMDQHIIEPGEVVSIFTLEELQLPDDIAATAYPMNKQSSEGLLVLNPGHVDPGFKGPLTVRALNLRKVPMAISREADIFTVVFERLATPTQLYARNKARHAREREYNARDVELSPRNLARLITLPANSPFPDRAEVERMIRKHTYGAVILLLAGVAAVFSFTTWWEARGATNAIGGEPMSIVPERSNTPNSEKTDDGRLLDREEPDEGTSGTREEPPGVVPAVSYDDDGSVGN